MKHVVLGDQDVGVAVAGEIDELQVGIVPVDDSGSDANGANGSQSSSSVRS